MEGVNGATFQVLRGASATVGIQSKQQLSSDQWDCTSGSGTSVTSGLRIALVHHDGMEPPA